MSTTASQIPSVTGSQLPLFGRKYQITVQLPDSEDLLTITDSSFEPQALRATFDIEQAALKSFWYAEICLYNLDQLTTDKLFSRPIKQGMIVTVSAGYLNGNYGVIWRGPVYQPLFDRENVVDFKITLNCILGLDQITRNFIAQPYAANTTQVELIQTLADTAFNKIQAGKGAVSPNVSTKKFPRGGVLFGSPDRHLSLWANDNNMQWWLSPNGLQFGRPDDDTPTSSVDFVYSPQNGIINVPQQTQYGVDFRVLLDPRLLIARPLPVVKIDNSQIRQQKRVIGQLQNILDQDGEYIVSAVRHFGDTRGNDWYSDITGITSTNGKMAMMQLANGGDPDIQMNSPGT